MNWKWEKITWTFTCILIRDFIFTVTASDYHIGNNEVHFHGACKTSQYFTPLFVSNTSKDVWVVPCDGICINIYTDRSPLALNPRIVEHYHT